LLLIDDDAKSLAQHGFQLEMNVVRLLQAMLARAIGGNIGHWARPVERDQCDDVLESIRSHVEQGASHALTFQLEDADRLCAREHGVGFFVIEGNRREIGFNAALAKKSNRCLQDRERLETEEVELHQSCKQRLL